MLLPNIYNCLAYLFPGGLGLECLVLLLGCHILTVVSLGNGDHRGRPVQRLGVDGQCGPGVLTVAHKDNVGRVGDVLSPVPIIRLRNIVLNVFP